MLRVDNDGVAVSFPRVAFQRVNRDQSDASAGNCRQLRGRGLNRSDQACCGATSIAWREIMAVKCRWKGGRMPSISLNLICERNGREVMGFHGSGLLSASTSANCGDGII